MPPPMPVRRGTASQLQNEVRPGEAASTALLRDGTTVVAGSGDTNDDDDEDGEEELAALAEQIDQLQDAADAKDSRIAELEALLTTAAAAGPGPDRSPGAIPMSGGGGGGGLTRTAAAKLEREFASQERILQGLQKDNEAKTIEVERLRREKKIMADYLARQYGAEDWEAVVFGPASSYVKNSGGQQIDTGSPPTSSRQQQQLLPPGSQSTGSQLVKGPLGRVAKTSDGAPDSSFYSADESVADVAGFLSSSPLPMGQVDLSAILSLIESQKLLIQGFERTNALKLVECDDKIRQAREREAAWTTRLCDQASSLR